MVDFREPGDLAIALNDLELIESHPRPPRDMEFYRHPRLGRVLVIDGEIQHIEAWQALYHEPLVHVPSSFVDNVQSVLILGGGSLFAAREVLRYPTVTDCTLVDDDPRVMDAMVRYYSHAQAVAGDARFAFVEDDAANYVRTCDRRFDLIINDWTNLTDDEGPDGGNLVRSMTSLLSPRGVCADVMYRHIFETTHLRRTRAALEPLGSTAYSLVIVPEYPGALHLLCIWGNAHVSQGTTSPRNRTQTAWKRGPRPPGLEFYDPRFLAFYLFLPPYIHAQLGC